MSEAANLALKDYSAYLAVRKDLIAARTGFFEALRGYLHPEQRVDAQALGDELDGAPCRIISEGAWIANPARGYLTVLEAPSAGRPFRLCVIQQGNELRIGVRLAHPQAIGGDAWEQRLAQTFAHQPPLRKNLTNGLRMLDWHFAANDLYRNAQAFEDAVFKVGTVFETALHALAKPSQKTTS